MMDTQVQGRVFVRCHETSEVGRQNYIPAQVLGLQMTRSQNYNVTKSLLGRVLLHTGTFRSPQKQVFTWDGVLLMEGFPVCLFLALYPSLHGITIVEMYYGLKGRM